jgi:hypothetical protein
MGNLQWNGWVRLQNYEVSVQQICALHVRMADARSNSEILM